MTRWKDMTEEQKARARESQRRYRSTPRAKAMLYERIKRWNEKNPGRKRELEHLRWLRKKNDDDWMANKSAVLTEWREKNRLKCREYFKKWKDKNRVKYNNLQKKYVDEQRLKMARNPELYAEYRRKRREMRRRKAERIGKTFTPRPSRCIPDYVPFCGSSHFTERSTFVRNNHDATSLSEYDGYARELAISRMEQMEL